ncbi:MAG: tetratricopeptide repeat protein [Candidatus Levybacteria bacterium]|nr:tetratricopeptide repeat protein [Candidatus Levybacteria bacterium]
MESKNDVSAYLENISILLFGLLLAVFPLTITTLTTDPFGFPKQLLLIGICLILLLLGGARMISEAEVRMVRTPFDIPILLFGGFALISALLSVSRIDSLTAIIPLLFAIVGYFLLINLSKNELATRFLTFAFLSGAAITALIALSSFLKVYVLPFAFAKTTSFTLLGSLLEQAMYLSFALPIAAYFVYNSPFFNTGGGKKGSVSLTTSFFSLISGLIILAGLSVTLYQLITTQKPLILPFETGFQTAFAAISQDAGRIMQGFLFGSGYGTYAIDFTRFKQAAFNLNPSLWSLTFFRSSSLLLELLATTGILGFLSFAFLLFRMLVDLKDMRSLGKQQSFNPLGATVMLLIIGAVLLPFSALTIIVFFLLLGLYGAYQRLNPQSAHKFFEVELHFVAFKKGLLPLATTPVDEHGNPLTTRTNRQEQMLTKFLPVSVFIFFVIIAAAVGIYTYQYTLSDITFQKSLVAASQNNGLETFTQQNNALSTFPYRDAYYRIASQTDLALANSLAASVPQGSSPSAQLQQNILALIQQSVAYGRRATELSPQNAVNWQNLSSIYRALIGFGQNAEQFSLVTQQQAIALNPNDPQGYINLGGTYYQLGLWDNAQQQFQVAINLKPDFANAYYNLGHSLEQKGDLQNALLAYQTVKTLVSADKEAEKKITAEIDALQAKIGQANNAKTGQQASQTGGANQPPLGLSTPPAQLPEQKNQVKIPSPAVTVTPTPSPTGTVSPTPSL